MVEYADGQDVACVYSALFVRPECIFHYLPDGRESLASYHSI